MKKWEEPKLMTLGINNTFEFDSSLGHACHKFDPLENCPEFGKEHNYDAGYWKHTDPQWNNEHEHTCCCSELLS